MKKILISLSAVIGVAALVSAATYAAFSDTVTVEGNVVTTATINLEQNNDGYPHGYEFKPIVASNVYPGSSVGPEYIGLDNNSAAPLKVSFYADVPDDEGNMCEAYTLKVEVYPFAHPELATTAYNSLLSGVDSPEEAVVLNASLAADARMTVKQTLTLSSEVGNEYQGKTCAWNEQFVGETIAPQS